ncbi:hypothetical protein U27_03627 [Candidatus Vecturithrix granuli]|uniref:YlbF family regulator n=1 Tax=Vecturithrix granuli TaxID=1499967 RepID=A0A081BWF9_VECG1|nr:hypothetical protein U27_03627 [Candidatus Vecturithrix granuli]
MEQFNQEAMIAQAKTFAKILASSQDFQKFYAAQERFHQDQEARALVGTFQEKQRKFQEARMRGTTLHDDDLDELRRLQQDVQRNQTIMAWAKAQQEVIRLIQSANQTISAAAGFDFGQTLSGNGSC